MPICRTLWHNGDIWPDRRGGMPDAWCLLPVQTQSGPRTFLLRAIF
jgi:hypothetical protein